MKILRNTFSKKERLTGEKEIELLYQKGYSFLVHPIVVYVLDAQDAAHSRILVSVSKRKFKKAVHRNLLKRRMREAYRLNKSELTRHSIIGFIYVANQLMPFDIIEKSVKEALERVSKAPLQAVGTIQR